MRAWILISALLLGLVDLGFGISERDWATERAAADEGTVEAMDGTDPQPPPRP